MQPTSLPFGQGSILVTTSDFQQGFQAGQQEYTAHKALRAMDPQPFTDWSLTELFLEKLEDLRFSSPYGIGFTAGFLLALATDSQENGGSHA